MYHSLFTYHTFRLFPVFHYCKELQWTQYLYKYWHTWAKISGGWFPTNGITGSICKITRTLYDFPKRLIYTNTLIHLYSHQARIRVTIIQKKKNACYPNAKLTSPPPSLLVWLSTHPLLYVGLLHQVSWPAGQRLYCSGQTPAACHCYPTWSTHSFVQQVLLLSAYQCPSTWATLWNR